MRMMIEDEPSRLASSDARKELTVAWLKPGRGACAYQLMNSFKATTGRLRLAG